MRRLKSAVEQRKVELHVWTLKGTYNRHISTAPQTYVTPTTVTQEIEGAAKLMGRFATGEQRNHFM